MQLNPGITINCNIDLSLSSFTDTTEVTGYWNMLQNVIVHAHNEWSNKSKKKNAQSIPIITPDKSIYRTPAKPSGPEVHDLSEDSPPPKCSTISCPIKDITPFVYMDKVEAEDVDTGLSLSLFDGKEIRESVVASIINIRKTYNNYSLAELVDLTFKQVQYLPIFQCHIKYDSVIHSTTTNDVYCGLCAFKQVYKLIGETYQNIDESFKSEVSNYIENLKVCIQEDPNSLGFESATKYLTKQTENLCSQSNHSVPDDLINLAHAMNEQLAIYQQQEGSTNKFKLCASTIGFGTSDICHVENLKKIFYDDVKFIAYHSTGNTKTKKCKITQHFYPLLAENTRQQDHSEIIIKLVKQILEKFINYTLSNILLFSCPDIFKKDIIKVKLPLLNTFYDFNFTNLCSMGLDKIMENEKSIPHGYLGSFTIDNYLLLLREQFLNLKKENVNILDTEFYTYIAKNDENNAKKLVKRQLDIINLKKKNRLYIPLNINTNHWVLIVVDLHGKNSRSYYYDSMPSNATTVLNVSTKIQNWLTSYYEGKDNIEWLEKCVEVVDIPKQSNTYDCGIYILMLSLIHI